MSELFYRKQAKQPDDAHSSNNVAIVITRKTYVRSRHNHYLPPAFLFHDEIGWVIFFLYNQTLIQVLIISYVATFCRAAGFC